MYKGGVQKVTNFQNIKNFAPSGFGKLLGGILRSPRRSSGQQTFRTKKESSILGNQTIEFPIDMDTFQHVLNVRQIENIHVK
jgi:hypothetical protein